MPQLLIWAHMEGGGALLIIIKNVMKMAQKNNLAKLHLATFIWQKWIKQTLFGENLFGVDSLRQKWSRKQTHTQSNVDKYYIDIYIYWIAKLYKFKNSK